MNNDLNTLVEWLRDTQTKNLKTLTPHAVRGESFVVLTNIALLDELKKIRELLEKLGTE